MAIECNCEISQHIALNISSLLACVLMDMEHVIKDSEFHSKTAALVLDVSSLKRLANNNCHRQLCQKDRSLIWRKTE
jgi:hypothetical protein